MRRAIVLVLAMVAALVSPVRQVCGTSCLAGVEGSARHGVAPQPEQQCHEPVRAPEPEPASESCTHDHTGSLRPAPRAPADVGATQPAIRAPLASASVLWTPTRAFTPLDVSRGSPALVRHLPLRI